MVACLCRSACVVHRSLRCNSIMCRGYDPISMYKHELYNVNVEKSSCDQLVTNRKLLVTDHGFIQRFVWGWPAGGSRLRLELAELRKRIILEMNTLKHPSDVPLDQTRKWSHKHGQNKVASISTTVAFPGTDPVAWREQ